MVDTRSPGERPLGNYLKVSGLQDVDSRERLASEKFVGFTRPALLHDNGSWNVNVDDDNEDDDGHDDIDGDSDDDNDDDRFLGSQDLSPLLRTKISYTTSLCTLYGALNSKNIINLSTAARFFLNSGFNRDTSRLLSIIFIWFYFFILWF